MVKAFFEWLYFRKPSFEGGTYCRRRILKIINLNTFLVAIYAGSSDEIAWCEGVTCHWNWHRLKGLIGLR